MHLDVLTSTFWLKMQSVVTSYEAWMGCQFPMTLRIWELRMMLQYLLQLSMQLKLICIPWEGTSCSQIYDLQIKNINTGTNLNVLNIM